MKSTGGLADVVHRPEWPEARREGPPDKLVVTLPVAVVLLRGVVHTGVGGVGGGELLLARNNMLQYIEDIRFLLLNLNVM